MVVCFMNRKEAQGKLALKEEKPEDKELNPKVKVLFGRIFQLMDIIKPVGIFIFLKCLDVR